MQIAVLVSALFFTQNAYTTMANAVRQAGLLSTGYKAMAACGDSRTFETNLNSTP
jgi:hypothetical protein